MKKILLVDDEVEVVEFLYDFLNRLGLNAQKTTCGREALEAFNSNRPDWVFLDMKMPDMDGIDVLRKMKEIDTETKAIIISGRNDEALIKEAASLGAKDYIVKPLDMDDLRVKIHKYILNE